MTAVTAKAKPASVTARIAAWRVSTSAYVSLVSGFTWSAASMSKTGTEAISGFFAVAGFEDRHYY
jgi:hypothetical protein